MKHAFYFYILYLINKLFGIIGTKCVPEIAALTWKHSGWHAVQKGQEATVSGSTAGRGRGSGNVLLF